MSTTWPWLARAVACLAPDSRPTSIPLTLLVDEAARRGNHDVSSAGTAATLAELLGNLCGPKPKLSQLALLELALIRDALDPERSPMDTATRLLHRAWLRTDEAPCEHAACLLRRGVGLRWALLGRPSLGASIAERAAELAARLPASLHPIGHALVGELAQLRTNLAWTAMAARLGQPEPSELLMRSVDAAVQLWNPTPALRERCMASWERQRAGVLGHRPLEGDLFVPLLLLEAMARAGIEVRGDISAQLEGRLGDGIRYYSSSHWMPHDADDAGAVLACWQLAGLDQGELEPLAEEARAVLGAARQPDGAIRTWVELPGTKADPPADQWFGPICCGVAARALRGATLTRAWELAALAESAAWLGGLADEDGGFTSSYYPSRTVSTALVVEALATPGTTEALAPDALREAVAWLRRQQRPDGSWEGGVEATAAAVMALDMAGSLTPALAADAAAWLVTAQREDGSWRGGDFMLCPQGDGELGPFGDRGLASAMAAAALGSARRVLAPARAAPGSA